MKKTERETGYYWVRYSYGGDRQWRVGWYNCMLMCWQLDGDSRSFHDGDFLEIGERSIPKTWVKSAVILRFVIAFFIVSIAGSLVGIYALILSLLK